MSDVIGGQVDMTVAFSAVSVGHVRSGRLRALAIAGPKRNPLLPDVPASAEAGYPGIVVSGWIGFFAPSKTPAVILTRLEGAFLAAERSEDYATWISSMGSEAVAMPSAQFVAEMHSDCDRWSQTAKRAHVALSR